MIHLSENVAVLPLFMTVVDGVVLHYVCIYVNEKNICNLWQENLRPYLLYLLSF